MAVAPPVSRLSAEPPGHTVFLLALLEGELDGERGSGETALTLTGER